MKNTWMLVALMLWASQEGIAFAQSAAEYPSKPVRMLVPFGPGGMTDIVGRQIGAKLYESWHQPVIIDNRAGAGGNIGVEAAVRSPSDGYTMLLGNVSTNAINPHAYAGVLRVNPLKELKPVIVCCEVSMCIGASLAFPPKTVKELVALAKANPGKITYASAGIGSSPHLDGLKLSRLAGIEMIHVPFKGGGGAIMTALAGNEINWGVLNLSLAYSFGKAGKIKELAVSTARRVPEFPDVPTMAESGFPGVGAPQWQAFFVPAATPDAIVARLHTAIAQVIQRSDLKEFLAKNFLALVPNKDPGEAAAYVNADSERWAAIVRENNISLVD